MLEGSGLFDCMAARFATKGGWSIFNHSLGGWLLNGLYATTAIAAVRRGGQEARQLHPDRRIVRFWLAIAVLLALMLFNRLFEAQAFVALAASCAAREDGWYEGRRVVQALGILAVIAFGAVAAVFGARVLKPQATLEKIAFATLALLVTFVLARGVSLHQVDQAVGRAIGGVSISGVVEGVALAAILWAATQRPRP